MHLKSAAPKPSKLMPWDRLPAGKTPIGVIDPCYGSSRVIYGLPTPHHAHVTLPRLPLRRLDHDSTFFEFTPLVLDARVPLLHTWNMIPVNGDFLMSFELEIPRYLRQPAEWQVRFGLDRLSSPRCKGLLALSEFARRHALRVFQAHGYEHLADKLDVFRGGVWDPFAKGLPSPSGQPGNGRDRPLTAIVIGTQLFRKGGMYSIEAFERLRAQGLDVRLTLVGDFESRCYAFREGIPDREAWRRRAASHDWITLMPPVPFAQVFQLLLSHDVCLYPSLDESLGWLPIEAAMAGRPVIGARIAAFPEFVQHDKTGWLIDIDLDASERWVGLRLQGEAHRQALAEVRERMVSGIEAAMRRLAEAPDTGPTWGAAGRVAMQSMYDMAQAGADLEAIYRRALG